MILDFRALVDPRAGVGRTGGHLSLRLGTPREWVDRANTLVDPDRMEAALLALRASAPSWGVAADAVLSEFLDAVRQRHHDGRLSEGGWRTLLRSMVHAALRAAGRLRPGIGAPVALLASPGGEASEVLLALTATVLRERGFTVLDTGGEAQADVLEQIVQTQRPHLIVLLADYSVDMPTLALRMGGAGRIAARAGAELWLAGGAEWPRVDGALHLPSLAALSDAAGRRLKDGDSDQRVSLRAAD